MSKKPKDRRPYLPPVTRIELSEENIRGRWILLIILVLVAAVAIGLGMHYAMDVQPGWHEIQAACDEPNYSGEFHFMYDFSRTGGDAAAVNKALSLVYSDAVEEAYRIFSKDAQLEGYANLYYLNSHPNEVVTVDETLYDALRLLDAYQNRFLYLAPVYVEYNRVFNAESDAEAMMYDPRYDPESMEFISQLMVYVADASAVNLELLDDNQVKLCVSEEFLAFAEEYGIEAFLDFGWLRNAFVADYIAQCLESRGYTSGYLASFDGYTRSLKEAGELDVNLFHRAGTDIFAPAKMTYEAPMSLISVRDYPMSDLDRWSYHVYADGSITSSLIHPETGICGTNITDLTCYGDNIGCAELLLKMLPIVFADSFDRDQCAALSGDGIHSVWCQDRILYHTQNDIHLEILDNDQGIRYETSMVP